MSYRYYSPMRPVSIGTFPKPNGNEVITTFNFDEKTRVDDFFRPVWGYVEYMKPLTDKEMLDYELFEPQARREV